MKIVLVIIAGISLIAIAAISFYLLPPHLQVRSVELSMPTTQELLALKDIPDGPTSIRYLNTSSQKMPQGVLGHTVFVVEWADGKQFMIDAGMDAVTAIEFGKLLTSALGADEAVSHGNIAELLGADTQNIKGLGFTHLHIDHVQGIVPFCKQRGEGVTLYQTNWQRELQNFNTEDSESLLANSCLKRSVVSGAGLTTLDDFPGLGMLALGGHTPGSTMWAIPVDNTLWILSGDTTNNKAEMMSDTGKGFLYSYVMVPEDTGRLGKLRQWFKALDAENGMRVVVSHDLADVESSGIAKFSTM